MAEWSRSVYSSMVSTVSYDPDTSELSIEWVKGGTSIFSGVPEDVAQSLSNAPSVGRTIHTQIKPNYTHRRGE